MASDPVKAAEPAAPAPIARDARMAVSVFVERRKATTPWEDHVWRPAAVVPGAPATAPWTLVHQDAQSTQYFAGAVEVALFPRETANYRLNLSAVEPSVYVVLRREPNAPPGITLACATVSPGDAQAYMDGAHIVERVAMPEAMALWLAAYVAAYHVEERFAKRQREPHVSTRENRDGERNR